MSGNTSESIKTAIMTGQEIATPAAAEIQDMLGYMPNPDRILTELGGNVKVYRDMVDAHMDSVRDKRCAAVTSRPWTVANDAGDADKIRWIRDRLWNLGFRGIINQMLRAIGFGYAVHEIVWTEADSPYGTLILPGAIKERKQEWFLFDAAGNLILRRRDGTREIMPPRKFLVTRRSPSDINPYGDNVLSRCFWPLVFKKGGLKFWMTCVERYGMPKAVAKLPGSATEQEKAKTLKMLRMLVRDAVAVIANGQSVELVESSKTGNGDVDPHQALVKWADAEMSKAWLGETLTTEQTSAGGTQAMATVHNDVRADLALDDAAMIEESVNELLRWIWEINFPDDPGVPWFDILMPEDLKSARLDRDGKLAQTLGVRFNADYVADVYEIDKKYFTVADPQQPQGGAFAEGSHHDRHDCSCFAEGELKTNVQQMLSGLKPEELQDQIEELAKPIIDLAESSGSYSEFEAALSKAVPGLSSKSLEQSVNKLLLLSEMQGRADA